MTNQEKPNAVNGFMMVADHPALDFLNTVARIDGALVDFLQSDQDVLRWLKDAGWRVDADLTKPRSLLQAARALREIIRSLVERRTSGKRVDPAELNAFLSEARSYLKLEAKKDGSLQLNRKWKQRSAEEVLAPLAESAADLLAHGDFSLVRRCESEECVLWFYDRTKSHHRRWCSMATCGNRHKVAEYRKRQQANA
jgi:predicted RNA-binding Zn ribbon-like protein